MKTPLKIRRIRSAWRQIPILVECTKGKATGTTFINGQEIFVREFKAKECLATLEKLPWAKREHIRSMMLLKGAIEGVSGTFDDRIEIWVHHQNWLLHAKDGDVFDASLERRKAKWKKGAK